MEMLGVGRIRARPQHGGEPATGGLPHRPHEQGLRGIRFMSDGDTSPIFERDGRKIDGDALGMRVRIAARKPDRAAATVAASRERDNARAKHRGSERRHQILRKLRESEGECAIENWVVGHVDRSVVGQADRTHAHRLGDRAIGDRSRRGGNDFRFDMICSELGETRCRVGRLRGQRRHVDGGCTGAVPPPGGVSEDRGGRIGGRGDGLLAPASAHETDAQIISAPHALDVVVIAPWNIRIRRVGAFVQKFPVFAPFELILRPAT